MLTLLSPKAHDAAKRPKLEPPRLRHGSSSSSATPNGGQSSGTGSGSSSERQQGSEPPPTRQERVNSTASMAGSQHSSTAPSIAYRHSLDDNGPSPRTNHFDSGSPRDTHSRRPPSWPSRNRTESSHQPLPSLSDMLDDGKKNVDTPMVDASAYASGHAASGQMRLVGDGPTVLPPSRTPMLRHEPSSGGTTASSNSSTSINRIPGEGPLPIHALLADRTMSDTPDFIDKQPQPMPIAVAAANADDRRDPSFKIGHGPRGYGMHGPGSVDASEASANVGRTGFQAESSAFKHMKVEQSGEDVLMTAVTPTDDNGKGGFDGMSALLRAGEIVGRRGRPHP